MSNSATYYINSGSWHDCPVCKKRFFVSNPGEYVYKRNANKTVEYFCRYNHLRQWDREHEREAGMDNYEEW